MSLMQCAGAAKQAEEQNKKNCEIIMMRSIYFLAKNCIPHSTTYKELLNSKCIMATNCLKNILVKGHLMLSIHQDSVLGC